MGTRRGINYFFGGGENIFDPVSHHKMLCKVGKFLYKLARMHSGLTIVFVKKMKSKVFKTAT